MNENFTTFLQEHDVRYIIENGLEHCTVDGIPLEDFLQKEENESQHEFIRKNILTATLNFNHRVEEFIKNIIMNKHGPCNVEYYNYRVEFQLRGSAHLHGTLWVSLKNLSEQMNKENRERKNEQKWKTEERYLELFQLIKDEQLGNGTHEDDDIFLKDLADFTDWYVTCSLKDPSTRQIVLAVNKHKHFTQSCLKRGPNCKYHFPLFPCLKTIVAVPSRIKYSSDEEEEEKALAESKNILSRVKDVLENEELMEVAMKLYNNEIENYLVHEDIIQKIDLIIEERLLVDPYPKHDTQQVLNAYNEFSSDDLEDLDDVSNDDLIKLQKNHINLRWNGIDLTS